MSKSGGVAQLGERDSGTVKVTGPNPVVSTILSIDLAAGKDKSVIKLIKRYLNTPMIEPLNAPMSYGEIGRKLIGVAPLPPSAPMIYMNKELSKEEITNGYSKLFDTEEIKLGPKSDEVLNNGYFYAPYVPINLTALADVQPVMSELKAKWTPEVEQDLRVMHGIGVVVWPFYILGSRKLDLDDEIVTPEQFEFFQEMREHLEVFSRSNVRALEI